MGIESVNTFNGIFIGSVKSYNENTRELGVFIPKLMPSIAEEKKEIQLMTNYGNKNITIPYNTNIKTKSYIWVRARDTREKLPDIGSKVLIRFLEGNPNNGFWETFNPNNDYTIIENERYSKLFNVKINNKQISLSEDDLLEIILDDDYTITYTESGKNKKVYLTSNIKTKLSELEHLVGTEKTTLENKTISGIKTEIIPSSGLFKKIELLENKISELETEINFLKK